VDNKRIETIARNAKDTPMKSVTTESGSTIFEDGEAIYNDLAKKGRIHTNLV